MRIEVEILNVLGLHARPAAEFVRCVQGFTSEITIWKGDEHFSGGSILEVLTANLRFGVKVELEAIGSDAGPALESLHNLLHEIERQEDHELA